MVYRILCDELGDRFTRSDNMKLIQVESINDVLYTVEGELIQPLDFFEENKSSLLFIQGNCCERCFERIDKSRVFFAIIKDPEGFLKMTGKTKKTFVCPSTGKQLVPLWAYDPARK